MKRLDNILAAHGVSFRVSGDELLTHCPLCGDADPSEHLSISTRGRGWKCWRNKRQHSGKSYTRLLTILLRCSEERAKELLGFDDIRPLPSQDDFSAQWRHQLGLTPEERKLDRKLELPPEFRELEPDAPRSAGFWQYLQHPIPLGRGFTREQAIWASRAYDLHYAVSGKFAYRVIIPVYDRRRQLMTWTARTISSDSSAVRYLSLGKEFNRAAPGELLLGLPLLAEATNTRCLVVCEGPFDAIAVSTLGHERGVWGTCLFGLELSDSQADLLAELDSRFDMLRLALDPEEATFRVLNLRSSLPRRCVPLHLPLGFKDPGELTKSREGRDFVLSLAA